MSTITRKGLPRCRVSAGASGRVRREFGSDLVRSLNGLCDQRELTGYLDLLRDYAVVAATATLGAVAGGYVVPAVCALYIGVRQRHLSNLTHECIHTKLIVSRRVNDVLGHVITLTLGEPYTPYKREHRVHHARLGSPQDSMLRRYVARNAHRSWPSRRSFILQVIVGKAVWALPKSGFLTLAAKSSEESWAAATARWAAWLAASAMAAATGTLGMFAMYWAIPLIVVRPVVTWITDLGNHAGLIERDDPILRTRGWTSHWLTRHLLGGHNDDMYHPIHHWCPNIPWRRLPEAKALLERDFQRWPEVAWCSGYFFRRRATPNVPCVVEHIVATLHPQIQSGAASLPA